MNSLIIDNLLAAEIHKVKMIEYIWEKSFLIQVLVLLRALGLIKDFTIGPSKTWRGWLFYMSYPTWNEQISYNKKVSNLTHEKFQNLNPLCQSKLEFVI